MIIDSLSSSPFEPEYRVRDRELKDPRWRTSASTDAVETLLDRAIPDGECDRLRDEYGTIYDVRYRRHPTGGNIYPGFGSDVATYNNTRADEQEILAWLQRALELTL